MDESTDVTAVVSEEQPAISHEEYLELVSMRQSILELKAQKSDVLEFVNVAQQYAAQITPYPAHAWLARVFTLIARV